MANTTAPSEGAWSQLCHAFFPNQEFKYVCAHDKGVDEADLPELDLHPDDETYLSSIKHHLARGGFKTVLNDQVEIVTQVVRVNQVVFKKISNKYKNNYNRFIVPVSVPVPEGGKLCSILGVGINGLSIKNSNTKAISVDVPLGVAENGTRSNTRRHYESTQPGTSNHKTLQRISWVVTTAEGVPKWGVDYVDPSTAQASIKDCALTQRAIDIMDFQQSIKDELDEAADFEARQEHIAIWGGTMDKLKEYVEAMEENETKCDFSIQDAKAAMEFKLTARGLCLLFPGRIAIKIKGEDDESEQQKYEDGVLVPVIEFIMSMPRSLGEARFVTMKVNDKGKLKAFLDMNSSLQTSKWVLRRGLKKTEDAIPVKLEDLHLPELGFEENGSFDCGDDFEINVDDDIQAVKNQRGIKDNIIYVHEYTSAGVDAPKAIVSDVENPYGDYGTERCIDSEAEFNVAFDLTKATNKSSFHVSGNLAVDVIVINSRCLV